MIYRVLTIYIYHLVIYYLLCTIYLLFDLIYYFLQSQIVNALLRLGIVHK